MTLSEALKTGKLIVRKEWMPIPYGHVRELDQGKLVFYYEKASEPSETIDNSPGATITLEAFSKSLSLFDVLADDWQVKPESREYWLGIVKFQTHMHERKILQAFNKKPEGKQVDAEGNPFIHVKEILEEK